LRFVISNGACVKFLLVFSKRSLYAATRLSVIGNARAPYSGGCNLWQFFYGIWYLGHLFKSTENFMEIIPGNPSIGELNPREVAKYSDFGPIEGYILETVQDTR